MNLVPKGGPKSQSQLLRGSRTRFRSMMVWGSFEKAVFKIFLAKRELDKIKCPKTTFPKYF
jgi:hypothetical protein